MKAPDKIYIAETPNKLIEIWSDEPIEPKPYITEHEYIRKGALIDALNKILEARPPEAKGPASTIAAMVFQQLIERVKSL